MRGCVDEAGAGAYDEGLCPERKLCFLERLGIVEQKVRVAGGSTVLCLDEVGECFVGDEPAGENGVVE